MTLQEQINAASSGATISLPDGSEHVGNFTVAKPLTIQGKAIIRSPNAGPAVDIPPKTGPVSLLGKSLNEPLSVTHTTMIYDIIRWGAWQTSSLAEVPQGLTLENVDVFSADGQESQRGIAANGANFSIKNSKVRGIKMKGADTQAICGWNGPGPFKILDSYFEAAGENILFGGADARIPNLVPSDIEIRCCKLVKPLAWRGVWSAKNLLELKSARRVTIDGNVLENSWVDGQVGYGVLFTVRNQDGGNPWAVIEDVTFTNNSLLNVAGGFQLLGSDYNHPSQQSSRLKIANNVIQVNPALGGNGRLIMIQGYHDVQFLNNEANPSHTFLILTGANADGTPTLSKGLVYQNNLVSYGEYGLFTDSDRPMTTFAPDGRFSGNLVYGNVPESKKLAGNTYLPSRPSTIPAGVGVDMTALQAAQAGTVVTPPTPPPPPPPVATVPEYRDVSFVKDTESVRTALYQKQFGEGYAAYQEMSGNKIKFRKFR